MMMLGKRLQNAALLPSILVLSLSLGTPATCAADHGGRYFYRISRPNGIVMVVELYGYELDDAEACQEEAYRANSTAGTCALSKISTEIHPPGRFAVTTCPVPALSR
jgi:hypothetical protein